MGWVPSNDLGDDQGSWQKGVCVWGGGGLIGILLKVGVVRPAPGAGAYLIHIHIPG